MNSFDPLTLPLWIVNSNIITVAITDLEGNYIYTNELFKKRFAPLSEEILGKPFSLTVHPEDVEKCNTTAYECITNPNKFVIVEIRKPIKDSNDHEWTEWEFSLFKDATEKPIGILCLGYDVTKNKRLIREVEKKEKLVFDITYAQSHQVRGPMATILGLIDLINSDKTHDLDILMQYLGFLEELVKKLDIAINNIVKMSERDK